MPKKLAVLVLLCAVFLLQPVTVLAQTAPKGPGQPRATSKNPTLKSIQESQLKTIETGDPNLGSHITAYNGVASYMAGWIVCQAAGGCYAIDENGEPIVQSGLVEDMGRYMAMMYENQPATTQQFLAYAARNTGIVEPVQAQGLGFASLSPILVVWSTFRNVAYFFFLVIALVIGFAIMFRQRISSQTVVTAQQAIPQIIIALVLVTFSYAIAGLLIDLMYVIMQLLVVIFNQQDRDLIGRNIFQIAVDDVLGRGAGAVNESVSNFVQAITSGGGSGTDIISSGLAAISGLTFAVIFSIALLIGIFRLFFELLRTYVTIILSIAFSPIILMAGAIPGKNTFAGWVKSLVGNLITFPLVLLILIIFNILSENVTDQSGGFLPPYLIGQGSGQAITTLLALGIILISTDIVKQGQKAFGGGGGVFDQLSQAMGDAWKKGWTGDAELIPGLGFTNLAKSPLTARFGGISGQNAAIKAAAAGAGGFGALGGIGSQLKKEGRLGTRTLTAGAYPGFRDRYRQTAAGLGDTSAGLKEALEKQKKEQEEQKEKGQVKPMA